MFDVYSQFEESMIQAKMETVGESGSSEEGRQALYDKMHFKNQLFDGYLSILPDDLEIELRLARFEELMDNRPVLLSSVLLRQNPHNVNEWRKRVKLFEGKPREVSVAFLV